MNFDKLEGTGKERMHWLDIAKGIAIIAVTMGHVVASYQNSGLLLNATGLNFIYSFIESFQMPLFFTISGYLFQVSDKPNTNIKSRIIRKVSSYGLPYIIFSVGFWFLKAVTSSYVNTKLDISDLILIPLYPINFMWFIYALLVCTIIGILLNSLSINKKLILISSFILMQILPYISKLSVLNEINFVGTIFYQVLNWFFYFYIGAYAGTSFMQWLKKTEKNKKLFILNGVAMTVLVTTYFILNVEGPVINTVKALLCTTFFLQLSYHISRSSWLEYVGRNSFPIYLMHTLIIAFTRITMDKLGIGVVDGWIHLFVCTITGVVIPLVIFKISQNIWIIDFCFYPNRYISFKKT